MRRILTLTIVALMVATAFSASAFTTGYADRTASIDVVADDSGLIVLQDGNTGSLVDDTGDELTIDFSNGDADGANTNASFELGDPSAANETYAFNISQNAGAGEAKDLSLSYTMDDEPETTIEHVNFTVYDDTGTEQVSATEDSASGTYSLDTTETVYVVITVDTTDLSSTAALDGTLRIDLS